MIIKKNLFSKQQLRGIELAMLLNHDHHTRDYTSICRNLHCSFLTLQSELAHLATFAEVEALPYLEPHLTVKYHQEFGPQKLFQSILMETPSLHLLEALFFNQFDSLDELAEALFISLSTLKRLIKRTNVYLQLGFNCLIDVKTIQILGDEVSIRLLYFKYFSEAYDSYLWPFLDKVNEVALSDLIFLSTQKFSKRLTHSFFQHLKIMGAVNLVRFSQGYRMPYTYPRSLSLYKKIKEEPVLTRLADLFWRDFSQPLDSLALSEIFSTYFHQDLILNQEDFEKAKARTGSQNTISYEEWMSVLEGIEEDYSLKMSNRKEVCQLIYNATILKEHDLYENYLVYGYKEPFIDYFKNSYPQLLESLREEILEPFKAKKLACPEKQQNHLLYVLLVNWDNLFLHMSRSIDKQKVLVIERGTCNTGQFLIAYAGQYFDITIHEHYEINMHEIKEKYDVVLTDRSVENVEGIEIFFFSQLVPTIALDRLNQYLKRKVQKHFVKKPNTKRLSQKETPK